MTSVMLRPCLRLVGSVLGYRERDGSLNLQGFLAGRVVWGAARECIGSFPFGKLRVRVTQFWGWLPIKKIRSFASVGPAIGVGLGASGISSCQSLHRSFASLRMTTRGHADVGGAI